MGLFKKVLGVIKNHGRLDKNAKRIRPGIQRKLDNDPELKQANEQIEKDLQKLGKKMDKVNKDIEKKYKGTPLEKFFKI